MNDALRATVVAEALTWIGTPFHHAARVKGAGVDCLMLLAEVYERAGIAPHVEPPFYVPDWHLHRDAERYMEGLLAYAQPIDGPPLPGDIALFRFGRTFSHGAIVIEWPRLIHAYWAIGVVWGDATLHPLKDRPVRFFTPFLNHEDTKGTTEMDRFGLDIENGTRRSDTAVDI
jgi:NlpC/P60 family putative phage cell wall peptidase